MLKVLLFFLVSGSQYTYEVIPFETMHECRQAEIEQYSGYDSRCVIVTEQTVKDLESIIHGQNNER